MLLNYALCLQFRQPEVIYNDYTVPAQKFSYTRKSEFTLTGMQTMQVTNQERYHLSQRSGVIALFYAFKCVTCWEMQPTAISHINAWYAWLYTCLYLFLAVSQSSGSSGRGVCRLIPMWLLPPMRDLCAIALDGSDALLGLLSPAAGPSDTTSVSHNACMHGLYTFWGCLVFSVSIHGFSVYFFSVMMAHSSDIWVTVLAHPSVSSFPGGIPIASVWGHPRTFYFWNVLLSRTFYFWNVTFLGASMISNR